MISLDAVMARVRGGLPPGVTPRELDHFVSGRRDALEHTLDAALAEAGFNLFKGCSSRRESAHRM